MPMEQGGERRIERVQAQQPRHGNVELLAHPIVNRDVDGALECPLPLEASMHLADDLAVVCQVGFLGKQLADLARKLLGLRRTPGSVRSARLRRFRSARRA